MVTSFSKVPVKCNDEILLGNWGGFLTPTDFDDDIMF